VFTLGLLSLIFFCAPLASWIMGGIAINMASTDLSKMQYGRMDPSGEGQTRTGNILAIIGVVVTSIWFVIVLVARLSIIR
jgi:hypothetical protein